MGYPCREVLALNHDGIWRGDRKRVTKPVHQHLPKLRQLCWEGKWKEAEELLLLVAIATDQEADHPSELCARRLDQAGEDFQTLLNTHISDHQALYNGVSLHSGGSEIALPATTPEVVKTSY